MQHFIWVFNVCQSTHLSISRIKRVQHSKKVLTEMENCNLNWYKQQTLAKYCTQNVTSTNMASPMQNMKQQILKKEYCIFKLVLLGLRCLCKRSMIWFVCLFDLILNVPSTIFQLYREGSSWVEPVLS